MKDEKTKRGAGRVILTIVLAAVLVAGAGFLLYPTISNFLNEWQNTRQISTYEEDVESKEDAALAEELEAAKRYNENHKVNIIADAFDEEAEGEETALPSDPSYEELLNPLGNGVMGYIVIPKINVELALYHGVRANALENGVGHIEGTSLPVGGESTHSVLSGHRGLPGARLFTDLDQIGNGDRFYISILGETFAYEVNNILVVEPTQTETLAIQEGKDLVTLVTCTPYGVNSHRLLITGHRIPYDQEEQEVKETVQQNNASQKQTVFIIAALVVAAVIAVILIAVIRSCVRRKKRRRPQ